MAWVILVLVLLAAAFGILGAVIKAAAFLVLTDLLTVAALVAIAWYSFKVSSVAGSGTGSVATRRSGRGQRGENRRGTFRPTTTATRSEATLIAARQDRTSRRPMARNTAVMASPTAMNTRISRRSATRRPDRSSPTGTARSRSGGGSRPGLR